MSLQFTPIDLAQQSQYRSRLAVCPRVTADYSFVNLWSWANYYGLCWAWEESLVFIRQSRPEEILWAPIGDWQAIDWSAYNWDRVFPESETVPKRFCRVSEQLVQIWQSRSPRTLKTVETREHWDYLYDRRELVALKGNRFHKKKNLWRQFTKKYDYRIQPLDQSTVAAALGMQTDWCTWRDCESDTTLDAENEAIAKVLKNWDRLEGLTGGVLFVGDAVAAYTVAEPLTDDTILIHFEKGDPSYKGVYQAINQMFLSGLDENLAVVNREQDIGDEGLRKAKLSYHPTGFNRKFEVTF